MQAAASEQQAVQPVEAAPTASAPALNAPPAGNAVQAETTSNKRSAEHLGEDADQATSSKKTKTGALTRLLFWSMLIPLSTAHDPAATEDVTKMKRDRENTTMLVGGLPSTASEEDLQKLFRDVRLLLPQIATYADNVYSVARSERSCSFRKLMSHTLLSNSTRGSANPSLPDCESILMSQLPAKRAAGSDKRQKAGTRYRDRSASSLASDLIRYQLS